MHRLNQKHHGGFTLIELLIVVAIIAILAAIAVPNFLEAQTRSKVSRAHADMKSVDTAIQAYVVDWNNEPRALVPPSLDATLQSGAFSSWWGFVSKAVTTPVAYITSLPIMPFTDKEVLGFWNQIDSRNSANNQPYTVIRDTGTSRWTVGTVYATTHFPNVAITQQWRDTQDKAGYVIYTCGPDSQDSTVWGAPAFYDPTNGTVSFGDIYRFGAGSADDGDIKN